MRDLFFFFHHADRGTSHLVGILALVPHGDAQEIAEVEVRVGELREVERNLHGLTMGVPSMRI
jgi:hypothetical protein